MQPVPVGLPEDLGRYLADANAQLLGLLAPQAPTALYACATASLPPAASFTYCLAFVTDLSRLAASNGVNWLRTDTGAVIA